MTCMCKSLVLKLEVRIALGAEKDKRGAYGTVEIMKFLLAKWYQKQEFLTLLPFKFLL